jgi:hypothetical protein
MSEQMSRCLYLRVVYHPPEDLFWFPAIAQASVKTKLCWGMKRKNSRRSGEEGKMIRQAIDSLFRRGKFVEWYQASPARPSDKSKKKVKKRG